MHIPGSVEAHHQVNRKIQGDDEDEDEEKDESWTAIPAVFKMTSEIQMLSLLVSSRPFTHKLANICIKKEF